MPCRSLYSFSPTMALSTIKKLTIAHPKKNTGPACWMMATLSPGSAGDVRVHARVRSPGARLGDRQCLVRIFVAAHTPRVEPAKLGQTWRRDNRPVLHGDIEGNVGTGDVGGWQQPRTAGGGWDASSCQANVGRQQRAAARVEASRTDRFVKATHKGEEVQAVNLAHVLRRVGGLARVVPEGVRKGVASAGESDPCWWPGNAAGTQRGAQEG